MAQDQKNLVCLFKWTKTRLARRLFPIVKLKLRIVAESIRNPEELIFPTIPWFDHIRPTFIDPEARAVALFKKPMDP